jgi:hypothetical protein
VIVGIGLSGRFIATVLNVMVEQPDPRGILCFVMAIYSLAPQIRRESFRLVQSPGGSPWEGQVIATGWPRSCLYLGYRHLVLQEKIRGHESSCQVIEDNER